MERLPLETNLRARADVAIVGAGPVGLAIAIELARLDLTVLVLDRRAPPAEDAGLRPQLLVARAGDLATLRHLGVDVDDGRVVAPLATRCMLDLVSGARLCSDVRRERVTRTRDVAELSMQRPLALVPIGRLQGALLASALGAGVEVRYRCDVVQLRRHARGVSLRCRDGTAVHAAMAILATGASRALVESEPVLGSPGRRLIAGVLDAGGARGRWVRAELPVAGLDRTLRCTMLETPSDSGAGTALLVDPQLGPDASDGRLHDAFDAAARALGLGGVPALVAPQVFTTGVSSVTQRVLAGDGRAPVVVAGDAAQTGHVFSGQTCFVNVALALSLCDSLRTTRTSLVDGTPTATGLTAALTSYAEVSTRGARLLAAASERHVNPRPPGEWALARGARP